MRRKKLELQSSAPSWMRKTTASEAHLLVRGPFDPAPFELAAVVSTWTIVEVRGDCDVAGATKVVAACIVEVRGVCDVAGATKVVAACIVVVAAPIAWAQYKEYMLIAALISLVTGAGEQSILRRLLSHELTADDRSGRQ